MGLASGDHGVKSVLRGRYPNAFRTIHSLKDVVPDRRRATVAVDGNILARQVPPNARTFDEFCAAFAHMVASAGNAAATVVVSFDDPAITTHAKLEEQRRRDAAKSKKTDDADAWSHGDAYGPEELSSAPNIHAVAEDRVGRLRLFDEMARRHVACVSAPMDFMQMSKESDGARRMRNAFRSSESSLTYDGVDSRGARRTGERVAAFVGSDESIVRRLGDAAVGTRSSIGEGDIKLSHTLNVLAPFSTILADTVGLLVSIDTDSLCIELLQHLRYQMLIYDGRDDDDDRQAFDASLVRRYVCMRERSSKRDAQGAEAPTITYTCLDVVQLVHEFATHMYSLSPCVRDVHVRRLLGLLVWGWILCGCDFVFGAKGMRADVTLDTVCRIAAGVTPSVDVVPDAALEFLRCPSVEFMETHLLPTCRSFLDAVSSTLARMPRMKRQSEEARKVSDDLVRRATWVLSYWSMREFRTDLDAFGFKNIPEADESTIRDVIDAVVSVVERGHLRGEEFAAE